jgi:ABC-type Fe3+-hydroxamate transport system substrate-binding protein
MEAPRRPLRIVSLCPSITETVVALGGLKRLVAATRFCVRPQGLLWGLPRIGGTKDPRISQILDLKPDLVFANEEENRLEDVRALVDAGVEVDVSFPKTVSEVPAAIRSWGARLDAVSEGEAIASRIEGELRSLESSPPSMPFLYACWIWKDPWMTVSDDTYVADLLRLAGGVNVYAREAARYPATTPEESLSRGADVHFFPSEPFPFKADKHGAEIEKLFGSEKVRLFVEGDNLTWHGVRTLEGLAQMRKLREELAR